MNVYIWFRCTAVFRGLRKKNRLKGSWEMMIRSNSEIGKEVPLKLTKMCHAVTRLQVAGDTHQTILTLICHYSCPIVLCMLE
jgi:hypothetical protein